MPGLVSVIIRWTQYCFPQNMQNSVNIAGESAKTSTVLHIQAPHTLLLHYDWTLRLYVAVTYTFQT